MQNFSKWWFWWNKDWMLFINIFSFERIPFSSTHQFHTKNPSVPRQKPFSSTHPQFHTKKPSVQHTSEFHTKNPSIQYQKSLSSTHSLNWGVFGVELRDFDVELRGLWCWTGVFLVWNWGVFGVELRGFWCGTEGFWGLKRSGPFGCKWCVELRGCGTEGNPLKQFY